MRFTTTLVVAAAVAPVLVSAVPLEARAATGGANPAARKPAGSNRPASTSGQWADVVGSAAGIGTRIADHIAATRMQRDLNERDIARDAEELEARAATAGRKPAGRSRPASTAGQWADVVNDAAGIGTRIADHVAATRMQRDLGEDINAHDFGELDARYLGSEELDVRDFEELDARKLSLGSIGRAAHKVDTAAQYGTAVASIIADMGMAIHGAVLANKPKREEVEDILARDYLEEIVARDLEARRRRGSRGQSTAETVGSVVNAAGSLADMGMAIHGAVEANKQKREDSDQLVARELVERIFVGQGGLRGPISVNFPNGPFANEHIKREESLNSLI
ncbi:hypothetical protein EIP91_012371 [Steccherinum ochraceum]|uniref:Secreted protein n=1 Tax=Steccherinum ochraceum TaxID=92696 RepID=A0A4R0RX04_9APHY|nr:hypothetical protein EIP91_012371 [Steccherinum ochraceum]